MTRSALRALGYRITSFGITAGGVWNAWSRIYPTRPHPVADRHARPTCTACRQRGHLAVNGQCSPSEQALRLVQDGLSVRQDADRIGTTTQAVYAARDQRRRAA